MLIELRARNENSLHLYSTFNVAHHLKKPPRVIIKQKMIFCNLTKGLVSCKEHFKREKGGEPFEGSCCAQSEGHSRPGQGGINTTAS